MKFVKSPGTHFSETYEDPVSIANLTNASLTCNLVATIKTFFQAFVASSKSAFTFANFSAVFTKFITCIQFTEAYI